MLFCERGEHLTDDFGLKIGIEGEREFKNAIRQINQSFEADAGNRRG